jgi:starch synthase (maltosyl-transferring)
VAEFSRDQTGLDPSKLVVIANGVDVAGLADAEPIDLSQEGVAAGVPLLAWIGRLESQKDPLAAVEAMAQLQATHPECHLVLAGEGRLRGELEARIAALGLSQRVHLLGQVSEIPSLLARSCGLVLTSGWEGMPNVVLEAMAAGRPVVARVVEGVSELVEDSVTGWLVADDQISSLAAALERLLDDRVRAEEMGVRGRLKVAGEYSIEAMVAGYEALWERELAEMGG